MADIFNTVNHEAHGHAFEIVTIWSETEWQLMVLDEKKRHVGPIYSISMENAQDFEHYKKEPAVEALIDIAKADLDSGRVKSTVAMEQA
jgi:hypothetical protein